jgi:quinolinate synthase
MRDNAELIAEIKKLKEKQKAIILAHNYQLGEVQEIADFKGDSLELSQIAAKTDAEVIVFCGVQFMAETASVLCPDKLVLLPDVNSVCPMADMITVEQLRQKKAEYPKAKVICYVNSSAAVKAESDICCTSANAIKVAKSLPMSDEIIFVPDQYLGHYTASQIGRKTTLISENHQFSDKANFFLWHGYCPTHVRIKAEDVLRLKEEYPQAKVIVHPECRPEVIALADEILSTGGMCRFALKTEAKEIIVATEIGIIHRLKKENTGKRFIPVSEQAICPTMKLITLNEVLISLRELTYPVKIPEGIRLPAKSAIDKMLSIR